MVYMVYIDCVCPVTIINHIDKQDIGNFNMKEQSAWGFRPETHIKRQVTQHGCLPSLLGDGDKGNEKVYSEEQYFVLGRLEQPRQNKNL
jgi:hypothetical protein